jgi:putative DNA primase/helicase
VRGKQGGGIRRILPEVLGVTNATDLHRAMVERWLVSCVARARNPGAKCDAMLVLVGRQGAKKSTFFATLGGPFFGDSPIDIGTKEAPIVFGRFWIQELAELDGITSSRDAETIKRFTAVRSDTYRAPYARGAAEHKRRTVFCGSVNKGDFLVDPTGSRRFYCLTLPDGWVVPVALLQSIRDAVWAEAQDAYESGERWWFEREEDDIREEDAQQYVEEDAWQPLVEGWLDAGNGLVPFTTAKLLEMALKFEPHQIHRPARLRVVAILRRLGYTEKASPQGFRGSRVWVRSSR